MNIMCMQLIKSAELTVTKFEIVTLVCDLTKNSENIEMIDLIY